MTETERLWLFFAMVLGVVLLPGLDMASVMADSRIGRQRSRLLATAGVIAGGALMAHCGCRQWYVGKSPSPAKQACTAWRWQATMYGPGSNHGPR